MKLSGREAARFCVEPDRRMAGALIYGEDRVEVADRARRLAQVLLAGEENPEMALSRFDGAEARRDPAAVADTARARGFFGGRRVVLVDQATDGLTACFAGVLNGATQEDAFLVATAGILPARSKLRKLFETAENAAAAPVYGAGMDRDAVISLYQAEGGAPLSQDAEATMTAITSSMDGAQARDLVRRLALYGLSATEPLHPADIAAVGAAAEDADLDQFADAVADGAASEIGGHLLRLKAQGVAPVSISLALSRRFRAMHTVLSAVDAGASINDAVARLRPPVFGPRRDALARRCRRWGLAGVEAALSLVLETDGSLRGGSPADGFALLERASLKLALGGGRRFSG